MLSFYSHSTTTLKLSMLPLICSFLSHLPKFWMSYAASEWSSAQTERMCCSRPTLSPKRSRSSRFPERTKSDHRGDGGQGRMASPLILPSSLWTLRLRVFPLLRPLWRRRQHDDPGNVGIVERLVQVRHIAIDDLFQLVERGPK